jgi:hypothetical protein
MLAMVAIDDLWFYELRASTWCPVWLTLITVWNCFWAIDIDPTVLCTDDYVIVKAWLA